MLLLVSLTLLAWTGLLAAVRWGRTPAERGWLFLIACLVQIGVIAQSLSLFGAFDAGPVLGAQASLAGAAWLLRRPGAARRELDVRRVCRRCAGHWPLLVMLALVSALLALSAVEHWASPLRHIDELNYHGSRACYWIQNRSVLPFETHNDRQVCFAYLGELVFAWGLLFAKSESAGRMLCWLAFPAGLAGVYAVARQARVSRVGALAAVLLLASTPTVLTYAASIKPDMWQPALLLGTAWFAVRAARGPAGGAGRAMLLAALMLGLAAGVKNTALLAAPGLVAVCLARAGAVPRVRVLGAAAGGGLVGLVASGLGPLMAIQTATHGHPLGRVEFVRVHQPEWSGRQVAVHAARTPLYLFELPEYPGEAMRRAVEEAGRRLAAGLGADTLLPLESESGWPNRFQFTAPPTAVHYSLGGTVWLPILGVGLVRVGRELWKRRRSPRLSGVTVLVLVQTPLLLGMVFTIRWMGGGPERFWLGAYALSVPLTLYFVQRWSRLTPAVVALGVFSLAWQTYPSLKGRAARVESAWAARAAPLPAGEVAGVLPPIEAGSRVLLIGGQNTPDYPMFGPGAGYTNRVIPWGQGPFDGARLDDLIRSRAITHVLVVHPAAVDFLGRGLRTGPFIRHLESRDDFAPAPAVGAGPRLFHRPGPPEGRPRPTGVPGSAGAGLDGPS